MGKLSLRDVGKKDPQRRFFPRGWGALFCTRSRTESAFSDHFLRGKHCRNRECKGERSRCWLSASQKDPERGLGMRYTHRQLFHSLIQEVIMREGQIKGMILRGTNCNI